MKGFKVAPGVSWTDVADVVREFEAEFGCALSLEVRLAGPNSGGVNRLRISGNADSGASGFASCWQRHYSLSWPTNQNRSMPGLFMRLVWEFAEDLRTHPPKAGKAVNGIYSPIS